MHADFRGQGIGRAMLERALGMSRTCRLERIELEVFSGNVPAIEFYTSLDFEEEGIKRRARKVDGVYEDIILMVRHI
jgi:ribosomal protein S18 acetylase RimI-like enzyme